MKVLTTIGLAFAFYFTNAEEIQVRSDSLEITMCEIDSSSLSIRIKNTSDDYLYFLNTHLIISSEKEDSCYFATHSDSLLTCVKIMEAIVVGVVMHPNIRHQKYVPVKELAPGKDTILSLRLDFFTNIIYKDKLVSCRYRYELETSGELIVKGSVLYSSAPIEKRFSVIGTTMIDADAYYRNVVDFELPIPVY